jgi:hypothetical protein
MENPAANRPSVEQLLSDAASGYTGVDRRFVQAILEQNDPAAILRFARSPQDQYKIDVSPLLTDLFRHYQSPEALEFYIDVIRQNPEEVDEGLIQALLPFGGKAVEPLLALYEELGEEAGGDIAFLLAALRVRDSRVLGILLDRLEYDAADGAFCLGLYGDPAARPALEKMLGEIPEEDVQLRREIQYALEQLDAPAPEYQPEPFDILAEYPERDLPPFDVLDEGERLNLFASTDADIRAGAAHSFFNQELSPKAREALFRLAGSDPEPAVRAQAWAALGDAASGETIEEKEIRAALVTVLSDDSKPVEERGGAAVGLYAVADQEDVRKGIEALYALGGKARARALEAMWRSGSRMPSISLHIWTTVIPKIRIPTCCARRCAAPDISG